MNNLHRHTPGLDAFRYGFPFPDAKWGRGGRCLGWTKGLQIGRERGFFFVFFLWFVPSSPPPSRVPPPDPMKDF